MHIKHASRYCQTQLTSFAAHMQGAQTFEVPISNPHKIKFMGVYVCDNTPEEWVRVERRILDEEWIYHLYLRSDGRNVFYYRRS